MAALPWRLKAWNGSAWVNAELRKWDGSSMVTCNMYFWDGSSWVLCTDRTPPTSTFTLQYSQVFSGSYYSTTQRSTSNRYQGDSGADGFNIQYSMFGFGGQPSADMAGFTALYGCRIFMENFHTWYAAGGTASIGTHTNFGNPGFFSANRFNVVNVHFNRGEAKWVNLGTNFAQWEAEQSMYGTTLYIYSTNVEYYGYYNQNATLEVSFEK